MTPELTVLALAALLQAVQIGLAAVAMNRDIGPEWNVGPRDTQPDFSPLTGRLRRAVNNHFEALCFFTIAVVVVTLSGAATSLTALCAWIYLAARVLYIPAYAFGWTPWRSVIFGVGFLATFVMILAALI
ncbi:MAPEG family protein [Haematobacter massiliensis]|uniref:Membrane protein n=1 Tax=Haematobacter massiliensis TaxID=195105 RepID=A0A086YAU8_9RHOB|nr:MAPEG family protein [Haematobacter massiliensis]KFI31398.1 membrane protein [Haematobacter massiliensis]OWJ71700.1 MAPEG family protein [Haematobacter massiliensis]OWJ88137.1 MAPEG family protein [Haematobacter massiliensis]QBJ23479.1 MAPEG family protein [Haematobacter massiliensis]